MAKFRYQTKSGVKDYLELSKIIQEKLFDTLVKDIKIENGWKVLDIGCGTGNNSFKLSQMVGEQGKIVAIDPIKDRISEAKSSYISPNLSFHEASGKEVTKFGSDFDLAVASTVVHWIPREDRKGIFEGIRQTLKEEGSFVFNMTKQNTINMMPISEKLNPDGEYLGGNYFPGISTDELIELGLNSGFTNVQVREERVSIPLPSVDHYLRWYACSIHTRNYEETLQKVREICEKEDITSCVYDSEGRVAYEQTYFFGYFQK
ncbi:demethylmenaquinone methyltransferase-like [Clytia hemisphaerica]|uniref:demethylmenaquinone methyltransferase-like n=1 Tax=Clytia hemisphaerica TaxID=252671 RepID=UPI0034D50974